MGTTVLSNPRMARVALLLFSLVVATLGQQYPCKEMTVADCEISEDNIISRYNFNAAICESQCKRSDHCQFWRVYQNDTMELPECLHLSIDYHQDCISFAGPVDGDINSCLDIDFGTCSAYIGEDCQYTGERLVGLEPPAGDVSSIADCQEWGKEVQSLGANYFYFSGVTEECQMFATMQSSCSAIGGPAAAPPLEECEEWTLIQKRGQFGNPKDFFSSKLWDDYVAGFGEPEKEFWLGLTAISELTKYGNWELRVDLVDFEGSKYTAYYSEFQVEEAPLYRLSIAGFDTPMSTVQDSLSYSNGMAFSTSDNDNDHHEDLNCAEYFLGAWWYNHCHRSNLNGFNYNNGSLPELRPEFYAKGIIWNNYVNVPDHDVYFSWPQVSMHIKRKL